MQQVILGLLILHGPLSLYAVQRQFQQGVSLFYSASFGSIQRALRHLVATGMVTVADAPGSSRRRKLHTVTDAGRQVWRSWMHEPIGGANAETALLAKVYLLGLLATDDERREVIAGLRTQVVAARDELSGLARHLDSLQVDDAYAPTFRYQRATLDYGLRSHDLALRWLDELT
jgi:DNA-binding PadR family transcriptional regulator